ncbi:MAG: metal-dependent transcriptional regulator [Gemmatimonadales bacterium]|nr:MAG: metal-dependent transcriptional regulator [Gemmatimonadales bacterium]
MVSEENHSRAVEDYLKAVYKLEHGASPASTSDLAKRLGRSAASVTNMIKSLAEQGLVTHVPYHGVRLSAEGRQAALRIIRRHRIIESYLIERLGYTWDGVHPEAERLEHAVSDDLVDRMARALGDPATDPHGSPIPTREGSITRSELQPLAETRPGTSAVIRQVADRDGDRLRTLSTIGLLLGTRIDVLAISEAGACTLRIGTAEHCLDANLAAGIQVEPTPTEKQRNVDPDKS